MNTALSLMAAGVRLMPANKKVEPDALLLGFMVLFFSYVAWLLWRASDEQR
jgi:hypothetical protein